MAMYIKLGFRNLFRNKRRTLLTALVIGISLAALIISNGMMLGITDNLVSAITESMVGEGQIHHHKFRSSLKAQYLIEDAPGLQQRLAADPRVRAFAPRTLSFAMLAAPKGMGNVMVVGIDPAKEQTISRLNRQIVAGDYVNGRDALVIGARLRDRLQVRVGDKVVLTMTQVATGEVAQQLLRITGVFQSGSRALDETSIYLHIAKTRELLSIGTKAHEIALAFHDRLALEQPSHAFWQDYSQGQNAAESWQQILASFVTMMKAGEQSQGLVALILMILVGISITNTLFMALYERMFEFAVLKALGTKSRGIVIMILAESVFLGVLSLGIAAIATALAGVPLAIWGLDYSGVEFSDVTFIEPITYVPSLYQFTVLPVAALVFTAAVAVYPALYAGRIKVIDAIGRSI